MQGRAPTCHPWPPTRSPLSRDRARARHCARSLLGGGAARALAVRARSAALVGDGSRATGAHCTSETALSLGARPCSDMLSTASNKQPAFACAHTRTCHWACSLSGGGAARALAPRARCTALVGVGPYPMEAHCASETVLSLSARPCSDVPSTASNEQPAFACANTRTRHWACYLSGGGDGDARALRVRGAGPRSSVSVPRRFFAVVLKTSPASSRFPLLTY